ncbi:Aspartyl protease [Amycolatopsis pretoriensis]|uniref:Aspartyl protease n=2 Tax=Amycolatopsis pretoriensis TaxID=218821 RepID=A0A1H5R1J1_9PSEU|nr:Aspartyl protease [Amycolatopsis pretoriensis]
MDRRTLLRRTGLAAAAGAAVPLLGVPGGSALAASSDPDALFKTGRFAEADRDYAALLRTDPDDAHAVARRGYIALLSNEFTTAERFLTRAVELTPDDTFSRRQLVDCYVRQDQLARAVPLLGDSPDAAVYAAITGRPFETHGAQATSVPFIDVDPLPHIDASLNGAAPSRFYLDTGGTLNLSTDTAQQLGLRALATSQAFLGGQLVTTYLGVLNSLRLGDIELRNLPVHWHDSDRNVMGTSIFYHFVTTMDYANKSLVLRRKTREQVRQVRSAAARHGARPQPLWLADGHFPFTLGTLNGYGPAVVELDTGVPSLGVTTTAEMATRAGVAIDYSKPIPFIGTTGYAITPPTVSIDGVVGRQVPGVAAPVTLYDRVQFDTLANFSHQYLRTSTLTFDYADMNLYLW